MLRIIILFLKHIAEKSGDFNSFGSNKRSKRIINLFIIIELLRRENELWNLLYILISDLNKCRDDLSRFCRIKILMPNLNEESTLNISFLTRII